MGLSCSKGVPDSDLVALCHESMSTWYQRVFTDGIWRFDDWQAPRTGRLFDIGTHRILKKLNVRSHRSMNVASAAASLGSSSTENLQKIHSQSESALGATVLSESTSSFTSPLSSNWKPELESIGLITNALLTSNASEQYIENLKKAVDLLQKEIIRAEVCGVFLELHSIVI